MFCEGLGCNIWGSSWQELECHPPAGSTPALPAACSESSPCASFLLSSPLRAAMPPLEGLVGGDTLGT